MYKVTVDGTTIHDSALGDPAVLVLDGIIKKQANKADSFTFTIYPNNVGYGSIQTLASVIEVYKDDELLFRGRPISLADGWENQRTYTCEGDFAFFNDTILRPYSFTGTVQNYLQTLITQHNNQVSADKQFTLRTVTVTPNDNIVRSNQDHVTTMSEIQEKLLNSLGGYMVVEFRNNTLYLDYLEDGVSSSSQKITIAKNLIDFAREQTGENIATVLVPLGARDESTGERLTIKSVNNGLDYIEDAAAVAQYGRVVTTQIWDDVTVPANLLAKAQARMSDYTAIIPKLTITTVDLSLTDQSIDPIRVLEYVTVEDDQHAASGRYLVSEREYHLSAPEQDQVTFGGTQRSISNASAAVKQAIEVVEGQVLSASERVRAILESATGGNIYFVYDNDGVLSEILIMDTDDPSTAQKIWRWNINGWGYSGDGGRTYTVAATMDGEILASMIATGILKSRESATNPKFYLNMDTGELRMRDGTFSGAINGGSININNTFTVDSNGNVVANSLESNNARITGGSIQISSDASTYDTITLRYLGSYASMGSARIAVCNEGNGYTTQYEGGGILTRKTTGGSSATIYLAASTYGGGLSLRNTDGSKDTAYLGSASDGGFFYLCDENGDWTTTLYPNPGNNAKLLGSTNSSSWTSVYVGGMMPRYRAFVLVACRGAVDGGRGAMASTYIPYELARLCTGTSYESHVTSAQNSAYAGRCYFDFTNNRVYIVSSGNADCMIKIYGIT
ncbi:MAG: phage tail protein [Lachnospiraceae bacterium]|nr:phage tail protein [Lachnospiraceae bacterium]